MCQIYSFGLMDVFLRALKDQSCAETEVLQNVASDAVRALID